MIHRKMYVAIGLLLLCMYGLSKDINKINAVIAGVIISIFTLFGGDCRLLV